MRFSLVIVVFLCACQPQPDVELERARANFDDFTKGIFSPRDCKRVSMNVRRNQAKAIEAVVVWSSDDQVPPRTTLTSVFRADPDAGWKCDASRSSSVGACELLVTCKLMREAHEPSLGDIRIESTPKR